MSLKISGIPGGLYGSERPDNFPHQNDYRNPIIAEALKIMGYVNKFNRGIAIA
jgi:ATP-dependent DNA helicase RecG